MRAFTSKMGVHFYEGGRKFTKLLFTKSGFSVKKVEVCEEEGFRFKAIKVPEEEYSS